ncbi:hypothetical protein GQ607_002383 [Colletotrichum asianum]|uniref:Uncharacterized protein n=1 Tax=Colletotrichum asianum TaxID=702518 RepID=A0A8H3ZS47_9PEZI|nr:hypothetical protein GQ607_002383 [Colletotrichum asianum]
MSAYHLPELRPENYGTCDPRSVPHGMLHFVPYSETGTCPASAAFNGGTSLAELSLLSKILEELRRLHAKVNILEGRSRPTLSVKTQADELTRQFPSPNDGSRHWDAYSPGTPEAMDSGIITPRGSNSA